MKSNHTDGSSSQGMEKRVPPAKTARNYRILLIAILVMLSVQAWFGDFVNIFAAPSNGTSPPVQSLEGLISGIESLGFPLIWHAFEGLVLIGIALALLVLSFIWSNSRAVRISAILAFFFLIAAAIGGALFVLSGFSSGGDSMQMGGSFVGAYAMYFVTLYFAK
ncbi:MAG: hypothetical protein ACYCQJ_09150 [Nitrososphaerales archaeon]